MPTNSWSEVFVVSFQNAWLKIIEYTPKVLVALLILILAQVIASLVSGIVRRVIEWTRLDQWLARSGMLRGLERNGIKFTFKDSLAWLVKVLVWVVALVVVSDILGAVQVTMFLSSIAMYIPSLVIGMVIIAIGLIIADFAYDVILRVAKTSGLQAGASSFLAVLGKWSIIVFAIMAALVQIGISSELVQILLTGLVGMLALAGGLAFGLGGKEKAAELINRIGKEVEVKENNT